MKYSTLERTHKYCDFPLCKLTTFKLSAPFCPAFPYNNCHNNMKNLYSLFRLEPPETKFSIIHVDMARLSYEDDERNVFLEFQYVLDCKLCVFKHDELCCWHQLDMATETCASRLDQA